MIVELSTDIAGACLFLKALADVNVRDCARSSALRRELIRRVETPGLIVYRRERTDVWTSFSVYCERIGIGSSRPLVGDCEDLAAVGAAYLSVRHRCGYVCITQPRADGMAHAYERSSLGSVIDPSVAWGMTRPRSTFYNDRRAETACLPVEVI